MWQTQQTIQSKIHCNWFVCLSIHLYLMTLFIRRPHWSCFVWINAFSIPSINQSINLNWIELNRILIMSILCLWAEAKYTYTLHIHTYIHHLRNELECFVIYAWDALIWNRLTRKTTINQRLFNTYLTHCSNVFRTFIRSFGATSHSQIKWHTMEQCEWPGAWCDRRSTFSFFKLAVTFHMLK